MQILGFGVTPALVLVNARLPDGPAPALHADVLRSCPGLAGRVVFVTDGVLGPEVASYLIAAELVALARPIDLDHVRALARLDPAGSRRAALTVPRLTAARDAPTLPAHPAVRPPAVEELRADAAPLELASAATLLAAPQGGPQGTVLVVDDDFDLRRTVRDILQDEGYTVETAANGREALARLQQGDPPRVVVLDLMMPVMDGWQLIDELQQDEALARIAVVVISASRTALRTARAHPFLAKPLDYFKLVATVDRSMRAPALTT
jgi:CheY-like chemotaxis protein